MSGETMGGENLRSVDPQPVDPAPEHADPYVVPILAPGKRQIRHVRPPERNQQR